MGYNCGNCRIEFSNKRELVEHMLDAHNSPFIEGDLSEASDKILLQRANDNQHPKNGLAKVQQDKVKHARCD